MITTKLTRLALRLAWAAVMLSVSAVSLQGQVLRGRVVDDATGLPVGVGFVVLVDTSGAEVARTMSDRDGDFFLRAPAGTYTVRSERIGYRVTESPRIEIGPGATTYTLRINPVPVQLAAIEVTGRQNCRVSRSEGASSAILWEEIRKALSAAQWTARRERYSYTLGLTERELDANRDRVIRQRTRTELLRSAAPFRASSPSSLADSGYVQEEPDGGARYSAPDADVLLDPTFLNGHCFRVVRNDVLVGLEFEPVRNRRLPDVAGRLWMNEETAELQYLEFWYTGLGDVSRDRAARGEINFMQVADGEYVVGDWSIQIPELHRRGDTRDFRPRIDGYRDALGEVLEIRNAAGETVFQAEPAYLTGIVFDSTTNAPMPDATLTLLGTLLVETTDSTGRFGIAGPFRGRYGVMVRHPWLDSVGYAVGAIAEFRTGERSQLEIGIPHVDRIQAALCADADISAVHQRGGLSDTRTLVGQVVGLPEDTERRVVARWQVAGYTLAGHFSQRSAEAIAVTDSAGRYVACGLPVNTDILVHAEAGERYTTAARRIRFDIGPQAAIEVDGIRRPSSRPIWRADFELVEPTRRVEVALRGVITDATTGAPIEGATVSIWGTELSVRSGSSGEFSLLDPPPGPQQIYMRSVGYRPSIYSVALPVGRGLTIPPTVSALRPTAVRLATIDIEAEGAPYLTGFRERRNMGLGYFTTREEFEVYNPSEVADVVRRVPGLRIIPNPRFGTLLPDSSGLRDARKNIIQSGRRQGDCIIFYFVDGMRVGQSGTDPLDQIVNLDAVTAVEFYRSAAQTPARFSIAGGGCGAIVFWTR